LNEVDMSNREHTTENDALEALLTAHLRGELDGLVGRAEAAFRAEAAGELPRRRPMRLGMWGLWVAGAMAASVGIVWGVAARHAEPQKAITQVVTGGAVTSAEVEPAMVGAVTQYQTIDEGAVTVENEGPARRVRREVVQTVQWYDAQSGADIEVTIPHEQVVFVGVPAF
jgi:hypothetical protein